MVKLGDLEYISFSLVIDDAILVEIHDIQEENEN